MTTPQREYRAFIPACTERNIGKTKAFQLASAGLLEVFKIGSKKYIYIDSLLSLPQRLKEAANDAERG